MLTLCRFKADDKANTKLRNTLTISSINSSDYDAVFLPGGHGTMWDFPQSAMLTNLIETFDRSGKVVATVCHAAAALVNVKTTNEVPLVKERRVTGFTDSEELTVELEDVVPFLLETRLRSLGGQFEGAADFQPFILQDGTLITGQNPASSEPAAAAVLTSLAAP